MYFFLSLALSGGPLPGKHVLDSFHLHWAEGDANGSEHAINGKKSAAEVIRHMISNNVVHVFDKYRLRRACAASFKA